MSADITYFLVLLTVGALELVLSGRWNHFYFTTGFPIFRREIPLHDAHSPSPAVLYAASASNIAAALQFHKYQSGEIAFREKPLSVGDLGFLFRYTPVMRGVIRRHASAPAFVVEGLLNWSVIALALFVGSIYGFRPDALLIVGAFLFLLYYLQCRRFARVAVAFGALSSSEESAIGPAHGD